MDVESSPVAGVALVKPPFFEDRRGSFTKPYSAAVLEALGVDFRIAEVYWSSSIPGTVRGLHFQLPPAGIAKLVYVTSGRVHDVVVDLRRGSPTEGAVAEFDLTPASGAVLIPVGCAHGFETIEGPAHMCYLQDGPFDPVADAGIRWDSVGVAWRTAEPTLSDRDLALPPLDEFDSPFVWTAE